MVIFILSLYFVLRRPNNLQGWAEFLGIFATVLASIQYFPQIYTTYMLKRVGSLSIPMMCIQTPGSFLWAASLAARLGKQGWSAWGVYMVTGCLQGALLAMAIYFELQARKTQKPYREEPDDQTMNGHAAVGDSEETPLLRAGD
jgi:drug/metabolite transporter (DMT)-like permease